VYALSPNGKEAISCDFARIADCRPGYGYAGVRDRFFDDMAPEGSGVTHVNLETGEEKLLVSHKQLATLGEVMENRPDSKHHAYHLLCAPDGKRFILLHRWTQPGGRQLTRLITAAKDGSDLRIVIPERVRLSTSSGGIRTTFCPRRRAGWEIRVGAIFFSKTGRRESSKKWAVGVLDAGGHFSYLRNNQWILNDTYPKGDQRLQTPHLYEIPTNRRIDLGHFTLHPAYKDEWRVDTHPRLSRDERLVCIDSPYTGQGRQLHIIDITDVA
jgi:hypothetical protein